MTMYSGDMMDAEVPSPNCYCGEQAIHLLSWTGANPRRRFVKCRRYKVVGGCRMWKWVDPPMHPRMKMVLKKKQRVEVEVDFCG